MYLKHSEEWEHHENINQERGKTWRVDKDKEQ